MAKNKKPVHVTPRDDGWAVMREGNDRGSSVHRTQKEAELKGRRTAVTTRRSFICITKRGRLGNAIATATTPTRPKTRGRKRAVIEQPVA
jgi:hypothetical protein